MDGAHLKALRERLASRAPTTTQSTNPSVHPNPPSSQHFGLGWQPVPMSSYQLPQPPPFQQQQQQQMYQQTQPQYNFAPPYPHPHQQLPQPYFQPQPHQLSYPPPPPPPPPHHSQFIPAPPSPLMSLSPPIHPAPVQMLNQTHNEPLNLQPPLQQYQQQYHHHQQPQQQPQQQQFEHFQHMPQKRALDISQTTISTQPAAAFSSHFRAQPPNSLDGQHLVQLSGPTPAVYSSLNTVANPSFQVQPVPDCSSTRPVVPQSNVPLQRVNSMDFVNHTARIISQDDPSIHSEMCDYEHRIGQFLFSPAQENTNNVDPVTTGGGNNLEINSNCKSQPIAVSSFDDDDDQDEEFMVPLQNEAIISFVSGGHQQQQHQVSEQQQSAPQHIPIATPLVDLDALLADIDDDGSDDAQQQQPQEEQQQLVIDSNSMPLPPVDQTLPSSSSSSSSKQTTAANIDTDPLAYFNHYFSQQLPSESLLESLPAFDPTIHQKQANEQQQREQRRGETRQTNKSQYSEKSSSATSNSTPQALRASKADALKTMGTGNSLMAKLGWQGGGLGSDSNPGRIDTVIVQHRVGRGGINHGTNK